MISGMVRMLVTASSNPVNGRKAIGTAIAPPNVWKAPMMLSFFIYYYLQLSALAGQVTEVLPGQSPCSLSSRSSIVNA